MQKLFSSKHSKEGYTIMRLIKVSEYQKSYQYEQAKKHARRADIGRRSGRRGTGAWGVWRESE
jgi:hypothetical protein